MNISQASNGGQVVGSTLRLSVDDRRASLRHEAQLADQQGVAETNLALVWRELVRGVCVVVDSFFTDTRCCLVLDSSSARVDQALAGRPLVILEAMLCGVGQKRIALELDLAPSTVALNARLGLERLGISCRPSRVHPLLMLAATAAREQDSSATATQSHIQFSGRDLRVIGLLRPDARLQGLLPPAELEVVRCLVEGACYADIARRRRTAERTVANQLAAVFRRLNVSGRSELVQRLFALAGLTRGTAARHVLETTLPPPMLDDVIEGGSAETGDSRITGIRPWQAPGIAEIR